MSVIYDQKLEEPWQSARRGTKEPLCLFCGNRAGYPCIELRCDGHQDFRICSECVEAQMPSLWLDVLELTAILQMRRASGYNDLIMNRTSIESEIKQREAEKVREEEAVYRSAYPEAKNGHDAE